MATFEESLTKKLKEEEKEDQVPKASEAMAMGFMALGDAVSSASGVSTNYLGSYLKGKRSRKKKTGFEGLKELRLFKDLKMREEKYSREEDERKRKANLKISGSKESLQEHLNLSNAAGYNKAKTNYEKANPGKKFESVPGSNIPSWMDAAKETEKQQAKIIQKNVDRVEKVKAEQEKADKKRKIERLDKASDEIKERVKKGEGKWNDWEQKRENLQTAIFESIFDQLDGMVNPNFSLNDLTTIGNQVYYNRKFIGKDGKVSEEQIKVKLPVEEGLKGVFTGAYYDTFKGQAPVGYNRFNRTFQNILNEILKERSGAAVTRQEFDRLKAEFSIDKIKSASGILNAIKNMDRGYKAHLKKYTDAFKQAYPSDEAFQKYQNAGFTANKRIRNFNSKRENFNEIINSLIKRNPGEREKKLKRNWSIVQEMYKGQ